MALTILEEIGMKVLEPRGSLTFASAGAKSMKGEMRVRFDRALIENLMAKAPSAFTLAARNPERNLKVGGRDVIFSSVGGPAYVMDLTAGGAPAPMPRCATISSSIQSLNILHQEGGGPSSRSIFRRRYAPSRSLLCARSRSPTRTGSRRPWAANAPSMHWRWRRSRLARSREDLVGHAGLHLHHQHQFAVAARHPDGGRPDDHRRAWPVQGDDALHAGGRHVAGDACRCLGAAACRSPGRHRACARSCGRACRSCMAASPPMSTCTRARRLSARRNTRRPHRLRASSRAIIGVPFRSSNVTAANDVDAQAAYESVMSLWGCRHGRRPSDPACGGLARRRAHGVVREAHCRCRDAADDGGLFRAVRSRPRNAWRFDAIREVGPAGHYFGTAHTLARYETAFYTPLAVELGQLRDLARARVGRRQPSAPITSGSSCCRITSNRPSIRRIDEALKDYMERRKREGGAPAN